jgi:hypothetical protein
MAILNHGLIQAALIWIDVNDRVLDPGWNSFPKTGLRGKEIKPPNAAYLPLIAIPEHC